MRTSIPTPAPDTVVLLGYYGPGDGGGGIFSWNPTSVATDDGGLVIRPEWVTGSGRWQRHFDHTVSVRWFGAFASPGQPGATVYPGPGIGNLQAFQSAIRSLTPDLSPAYYGPRIIVPPGLYEMEGTLNVDRSVTIIGAGGFHAMSTSWLRFPAGVDGVCIYRDLPPPDPPPQPPLAQRPRGDFSKLEGLKITSHGGVDAGHGIRVNAVCSLADCYIQGFGGNGVHIEAAVPARGANSWKMSNVHIYNCHHGLYVDGPDTNAGNCIGVSVVANSGWGVFDSSFLGNTYIGCHAAGNGLGSYKSDGQNSRSIFLSCYAESDNPPRPADIVAPALVIGGHVTNSGTAGDIGQLTSGVKTVSPALRVSNELPLNSSHPTSPPVYGQLGSANVGGTAIEIVSGDDPRPYRLIYNNSTTDARAGWWEWNWANLGGGSVLAFCHEKANEWAEKMPQTAKAWLPRGVYLGMPSSRRTADNDGRVYVTVGAAPPTTGVWSKGDRVLNNSPEPGHAIRGCAGWICVQGSSVTAPAGAWVPFGTI